MIRFLLNLPWTIVGLAGAIISIPRSIKINHNPFAFVITVRRFWWAVGYMKGARAMAIGNLVILGPSLEDKDLEHELVHVNQYNRVPLIYPFLYYWELFRKGYRNNKYEEEAYRIAGNIYKTK